MRGRVRTYAPQRDRVTFIIVFIFFYFFFTHFFLPSARVILLSFLFIFFFATFSPRRALQECLRAAEQKIKHTQKRITDIMYVWKGALSFFCRPCRGGRNTLAVCDIIIIFFSFFFLLFTPSRKRLVGLKHVFDVTAFTRALNELLRATTRFTGFREHEIAYYYYYHHIIIWPGRARWRTDLFFLLFFSPEIRGTLVKSIQNVI